ncbi:MAG TPA: ABC transporter ATP-binding protein [Thermoanaerobaculia bacterium]|jgi:ABC-2 type transport system ATP-binding protein|nr:ABC transporter ATP-binding protein [Thermoanaerobaculia bacterium]
MSTGAATNNAGVVFHDVSKFYGEVLGVNGVTVNVEPGITALVGPNGAGKSTLMNLMTGLVAPTRGTISVLGHAPRDPEVFRRLGYCSQFDAFPRAATGFQFVAGFLRLFGYEEPEVRRRAAAAIERVGLAEAAKRRVAGYSKGMRQRVKLAQAMAHDPAVLVLDEPLNGLDPMARSEFISLFRELASEGRHVIVSSHILHEVDLIADQLVMLHQGYVVAEGEIPEMREEMVVDLDRPIQIQVRCSEPSRLAARLFGADHVIEVKLLPDGGGLVATTRDADRFYLLLNELASRGEVGVEAVAPADEDAHAVYRYLVGSEAS